jgi:hypothetical protein
VLIDDKLFCRIVLCHGEAASDFPISINKEKQEKVFQLSTRNAEDNYTISPDLCNNSEHLSKNQTKT